MASVARKRLLNVVAACEAIELFVSEKNFADYVKDHRLRSAMKQQFKIAGEALNQYLMYVFDACHMHPEISPDHKPSKPIDPRLR